ncbi:ribonuclease domain-containing protein [Usitatibacter palustris]|nr:ribonuclease domain-containing protein [Usitatibacter palustris]
MFHALLFAIAAAFALAPVPATAQKAPPPAVTDIALAQLPAEARDVLQRIRKGGPYDYAKDGAVFGNREARLPAQKRGYYHEYTVKTPGERTRGARRIVMGKGGEAYYTADHYNTFRRIRE